jgi:hypothetical protein
MFIMARDGMEGCDVILPSPESTTERVGNPKRWEGGEGISCKSNISGFYARSLQCPFSRSHPASYCFLTRFA